MKKRFHQIAFGSFLSLVLTLTAAAAERGQLFLTGPAKGDALEITQNYIQANREALGFAEADLADQVVKDRYVSRHNGVTHLYLQQRLGGIEIYHGDLAAHVAADGRIIKLNDRFVRNLGQPARAANPPLTAAEAVAAAANHLGEKLTKAVVVEAAPVGPAQQTRLSDGGITRDKIPAKLMYYPDEKLGLRLVWNLVLQLNDDQHWWDLNVDAETGKVLSKANWYVNHNYEVFALPREMPTDGGTATNDTRTLEIEPFFPVATNASPYGWHDTNGVVGVEFTDTRGNNVFAQEDRDANNSGGSRPDGGASLMFTNALNFSLDPTNTSYQAAAIVNLFYWNNIIHDVLYQYGFDEPSGNFQRNNFGRGGAGNDQVQADAQDGSGVNNANFGTPPDGSSGRMQMFIWTYASPRRDSDLDNGIIIHEYGHGVSTRLTGGPSNSSCLQGLQSGGMGEGWSDWWALTFTVKTNQNRFTARGIGTYVLNQSPTGAGIRSYRYSTDMAVNPITYADLPSRQQVHAAGEIWCVTIWEMYWNLVDAYGFDPDLYQGTGGNNLAMRLVIDGMKLQPCNPTMLDARDAILQADQINNGGANQALIWAAFAKRGMGFSAADGGDHNSSAVTAAFDIPDDLQLTPNTDFAASGSAGGPFSPSSTVYTVVNVGSNVLNWTVTTTTNWFDVSSTGGTLAVGQTNLVTVTLNSNANVLVAGLYTGTVRFSNTVSQVTQSRQVSLALDLDFFTELFGASDNDLDNQSWTFTPNGSGVFYSACRSAVASFPTDPAGGTTVALTDDSNANIILTGGAAVSLYGVSYTNLFIGSNGYITFGSGDTTYEESTSAHFNRPRVAALFDDLNPGSGGTVSYKQLSDRLAVTYQNVPQYGAADANSFQIELFFNGTIRVSYLGIAAPDGLVGLSQGLGLPSTFVESSFSGYDLCPPPLDLALTITDTPDPVVLNSNLTYTITVTNLGAGAVSSVTVTDTLPASVSFVTASPGCTYSAGQVICDLGTIAGGSQSNVSILVTPTGLGIITNTALVTSSTNESSTANNTATITTTVIILPENNAALANLVPSAGTLTPTFAADITNYTASVSYPTTSLTVTPTSQVTNSTLRVNGTPVASGTPSSAISLSVGANLITTEVVSGNLTVTNIYTLTVTRDPGSFNAHLANLVPSAGTLSPVFASNVFHYVANVPYATTSLTVTPTAADAHATIRVNGDVVASGTPSSAISLNVGSNSVNTVVVSENLTTTNSYELTVIRAAGSTNALLANLVPSAGTLDPTFDSTVFNYADNVAFGTGSLTVTPTAADPLATIKVNGTLVASGNPSGSISLNVGTNTIHTVVVSEDQSVTNTYAISAIRAASITRWWDGGSVDIATNGNAISDGGSGVWDTTTQNWDQGAGTPHGPWDNAGGNIAVFGGAAGTVTNQGVTVGGMIFTAAYTLTNNTVTFATAGSISNSAAVTIASAIAGTGPITKTGTGALTLSGVNSYTGGTVLNAGTLVVTADAQLGETNGGVTVNGAVILSRPNAVTFSFHAGRTWTIHAGARLTWSSGNAGQNFNGILTGSGVLSNSSTTGIAFNNPDNDFTGEVYNGYQTTLASIGDSTNAFHLVGSNSQLIWTGGAKTFALRPFTLNAVGTGNFINNGTGPVVIQQNLAITGAAGARTLTLGGTNAANNTFAGNIADATNSVVSLTKSGSGAWALAGTNTYSGATTMNFNNPAGGGLTFQGMQSLSTNTTLQESHSGGTGGHGPFRLLDDSATPAPRPTVNLTHNQANASQNMISLFVGNNGTLNGGTSAGTQENSTIQLGNLNFNQTTTGAAAGTGLSLTGANGYTLQIANINISLMPAYASTWNIRLNPSGAALIVAGNVQQLSGNTNNGTTTLQLDGGTTGNLISGNILNSADGSPTALAISKLSGGTWTLTGTNTYSGLTIITGGILQVGNGGTSGTLGSGNVTNNARLVFHRADTLTVANNIFGTGQLSQTGAGTLELAGSNTYTGITTVATGTLLYNGSLATGAGSIIVSNGATFAGTGTVNRTVTILDGATLAPGTSTGTLTVSNLVLNSTSVLAYELGTTSDQTVVTGNLTLDGTINITDAGGLANGHYTLFTYTTVTDNALDVGTMPGSFSGSISNDTGGKRILLVVTGGGAPPVANFSATPLSGVVPLQVVFTDLSTETPTSWAWDFDNDGSTDSTAPNPTNTYSAGTYSVKLIACNGDGCSTNLQTNYITAFTAQESWESAYGVGANGTDTDGDGATNLDEFLAGFNPTNSAALLRILNIARSGNDIRITFLGSNGDTSYAGGPSSRTNVLEFTTGTGNGGFTNNFMTTGLTNILSGGTGQGTNITVTETGGATNGPARYYRVTIHLGGQ